MAQLKALFLDVGGTLWPDTWPDDGRAAERVLSAVPHLPRATADRIVAGLRAREKELAASIEQHPLAAVHNVCVEAGLTLSTSELHDIQRAMAVPASAGTPMLPGAAELLAWAHSVRLAIVLVSNTTWRDAVGYREDLMQVGVEQYIDVIITSVDVGYRKPHEAIFQAALAASNYEAAEVVFIGDSEEKDIVPAKSLGMRTVRVAIEVPPPPTSAADAIATSLTEVQHILESWLAGVSVAG